MKALLLALLFFPLLCLATHNRAAQITYKRIPPYSTTSGGVTVDVYNYSITVTRYTDNGPAIADRCVDTIYFGDGARQAVQRSNGTPTCSCGGGCGVLISNAFGINIKE